MRVVIVGNGVAGNSAAHAIKRLSPSTHVTIVSEEREPFYCACALGRFVGALCDLEDLVVCSAEETLRLGIDVIAGERVQAVDADGNTVRLEHRVLEYDRLILATGSRPRLPSLPGATLSGVFTLKTLRDAKLLRNWRGTSAVVVGAGPVGIEVAVALKQRGIGVTLLELKDAVLAEVLYPEMSAAVQKVLETNGIRVEVGCRLESLEGDGAVKAVISSRGIMSCDTVVFAIGMVPNAELARSIGIDLGSHHGILVDDYLRTSVPGVLACGDCVESRDALTGAVGPSMLWMNAKRQGKVAGLNALGVGASYPGSVKAVALNVFGTTVFSAGATPSLLSTTSELQVRWFESARSLILGVLEGANLVGIQLVGRVGRLECGEIATRLVSGQPALASSRLALSGTRWNCTMLAAWSRLGFRW